MLLVNFLKAVLPEDGVKCWTSIHNKIAENHFCNSFEELAEQIQTSDAGGVDTYHACAAFKTSRNRRAANAAAMKSFWLDIDVGEGKPYATLQEAVRACDEFCDRVGVDIPGLVASGSGAHAYWCLDRAIASEDWLRVAQRIKLLTQAHGFHVDPTRTADPASILRPPGTKNYKLSAEDKSAGRRTPASPRAVEVIEEELFENIDADTFIATILAAGVPSRPAGLSSVSGSLQGNNVFTSGIRSAFDATKGVARGARGSTRIKYAGELVAKGLPAEEIFEKLTAWDQLCSPPEGEDAVRRSIASAFSMHAAKHPAPAVLTPTVQDTLPKLPNGFQWGNAGQLLVKLRMLDDAGVEREEIKVVCQLPVYLAGWLNEEGQQAKNSYLLRHLHPVEGWRAVAITSEDMNGKGFYAAIAKKGISIMPGMDKYFTNYIRAEENMLRLPGVEKTQYTQFGWKNTPAGENTAFLIGQRLFHSDGRIEDAIPAPKITALAEALQLARGGSLERWSEAANRLGALGLEPHLFMQVCSFAAPLMKWCTDEGNGGSILSVTSEESGKGKTPMITAMASVWGTLPSIRSTGNFTGNRLIDDIVCRCNLPQLQEEMNYIDPEITTEGVRKFTSGSDRGRLDQSGNAKGLPNLFQTLLVSVSNRSLRDTVAIIDLPMSCRIFEVELHDLDDALLENLGGTARDMLANCGYAGQQFVRLIVEPQINRFIREQLQCTPDGKIGHAVRKYRSLLNSRPEHRFIIWVLAAADVAAQILTHYKIMEFSVERLMGWAVKQATPYMTRSIQLGDVNLAAEKLNDFINEHINTCVTVAGPFKPREGPTMVIRQPVGGKLLMRMELKTNRLYVAQDALHKWCTQKGISFVGMGRKLKETNVVVASSKPTTLGAGTDIVSGRCLCWEVDTSHAQISCNTVLEIEDPNEKVVPLRN